MTESHFSDEKIQDAQEHLAGKDTQDILAWSLETFEDLAFGCSFGVEDVLLIQLFSELGRQPFVFTLDTGRLPEATYDVMERIRERYGMTIHSFFPEKLAVETLEREKGFYSFRDSIENRKECCQIRKVEPLQRALQGRAAWMTGLRKEQAVTRSELPVIERDVANGGLIKLNPLASWTTEQVWSYVKEHRVPYNRLHDEGYPSIGCAPCTRAVEDGEDIRAGRWWWENPEHKECGLHARPS